MQPDVAIGTRMSRSGHSKQIGPVRQRNMRLLHPGQARAHGMVAAHAQSAQQPALQGPTGPPLGPPPPPPPPPLERAGDLPDRLLRDYLSGWSSQYTEYDFYVPPEAVYGTLPEEIKGTLFLIGPGLTEVYGTTVRHPHDADGMVCSLAFAEGGQVFFRNRYVRTPSFVTEQTLGRRTTRGVNDRGAAEQQAGKAQQGGQSRQRHQQPPPQPQLPSAAALAAWVFNGTTGAASSSNGSSNNGSAPGSSNGTNTDTSSSGSSSSSSSSRLPTWGFNGSSNGSGSARSGREVDDEEALWGAAGDGVALTRAQSLAAAAFRGDRISPTLPTRLDPMALFGLPPLPPLSALFNPLDTAFRAPANANIVYWGGRLLAFTEGGSLPYELNKLTLETVGLYDVCGAMADMGRLVGGYKIAPAPPPPGKQQPSSASPSSASPSPRSQRLVVMGSAQSGPDVLLRWAELAEDGSLASGGGSSSGAGGGAGGSSSGAGAGGAGGSGSSSGGGGTTTTYRLPGATAQGVLDFWVTDRYYVVVQAPVDFNPQTFVTRASLGAASFAECFDWDAARPARIHLVARPAPPAPSNALAMAPGVGSGTAAVARTPGAAAAAGRGQRGSGSNAIVWPPKGPDAIVVDAPALLPTSCVGCYSLGTGGSVLVLDAVCQQGLTGSSGGAGDSSTPDAHRQQPKPELTRIVVDLSARTATARVLSQRTTVGVTTAAAFAGSAAAATTSATATATAAAAASGPLVPVGGGASSVGGYHHLFASAAATDAAAGWAPAQVLLKLALSPDAGLPPAAAAAAAAAGQAPPKAASPLARLRGRGAEMWSPGDRIFLGPPIFIPKRSASSLSSSASLSSSTSSSAAAAAAVRPAGSLPPLESEVDETARAAAADTAARRWQEEQDGWILVLCNDAETMRAELCVLDARDVTRGPVAIVALPHHIPHPRAMHFTRSYCGPGLAAPPGWRPRAAAVTAAATKPTA